MVDYFIPGHKVCRETIIHNHSTKIMQHSCPYLFHNLFVICSLIFYSMGWSPSILQHKGGIVNTLVNEYGADPNSIVSYLCSYSFTFSCFYNKMYIITLCI